MALTKITKTGITDQAVETAKIKADAIDATKIADDAVSEEHLDVTAITGNAELAAVASSDDVLLVFDTSSSTIKKIQVTNINSSPSITSVSPTNVLSGDGTGNHTFVITGTNFLTGVTANLINNSGTNVAFSSLTRNSITQLTGVIAKSALLNSGEPFDVEVRNSNGQSAKIVNQINVNASPVFVTASGSLGTGNEGASFSSVSVNATDPESAGNVTFELQSGALPGGITFANTAAEGGSAVFTGTYPTVSATTTFNFVLRAVDAASNTSSRAFSITSTNVPQRTSFTSSGTFAVPSGVTSISALVVAGGGGGSGGDANRGAGAGGGAGGLIFMPGYPVQPGTLTVTVGAGGDGGTASTNLGTSSGNTGQDSVLGAPSDPGKHPTGDILTAKGGGGGSSPNRTGQSGGSGGGAHSDGSDPGGAAIQPTQSGDSGAYGFGFAGGAGTPGGRAGSGGGAGAVGVHHSASPNLGGVGKAYTIADGTSSVYYAGGGGSGGHGPTGPTGSQGGQGGGGNGSDSASSNAQTGSANKGGGGGGGAENPGVSNAGAGGKGIVIIEY